MSVGPSAAPEEAARQSRGVDWKRLALLYLRLALGAAFLSGIADRFGLYGKNVGYGDFNGFMRYTAQVISFLPTSTIPFRAWAATIAEFVFGVMLVAGIWLRWAAFGSAVLLLLFAIAMAISFGIKSPLDYSVFTASAGALVLGLSVPQKK